MCVKVAEIVPMSYTPNHDHNDEPFTQFIDFIVDPEERLGRVRCTNRRCSS